ncbi:MAG: hypothetical protein AAFS10_15365, partial [Myxococcota bacterium]
MRSAALEGRWYGGLVKPVWPSVRSALKQVDAPGDPWRVPRTGLGGAVVLHVAQGFGRRRQQRRKASRAAVIAVEAYNQMIHRQVYGTGHDRTRWLERDLAWVQRVWRSMLEQDGALVGRVIERLLSGPDDLGDARIPEAVLFLRGAVAAGVVVGDVPDRIHGTLDRHVTWLGLAWEACRGTLDPGAWAGALGAVKLSEPYPEDPDTVARTRAHKELERLPGRPPVALFEAILAQTPVEPPAPRHPQAWEPHTSPEPTPTARLGLPGRGGALGSFEEQWHGSIETALGQMTHSGSQALGRATRYLREQGGKR